MQTPKRAHLAVNPSLNVHNGDSMPMTPMAQLDHRREIALDSAEKRKGKALPISSNHTKPDGNILFDATNDDIAAVGLDLMVRTAPDQVSKSRTRAPVLMSPLAKHDAKRREQQKAQENSKKIQLPLTDEVDELKIRLAEVRGQAMERQISADPLIRVAVDASSPQMNTRQVRTISADKTPLISTLVGDVSQIPPIEEETTQEQEDAEQIALQQTRADEVELAHQSGQTDSEFAGNFVGIDTHNSSAILATHEEEEDESRNIGAVIDAMEGDDMMPQIQESGSYGLWKHADGKKIGKHADDDAILLPEGEDGEEEEDAFEEIKEEPDVLLSPENAEMAAALSRDAAAYLILPPTDVGNEDDVELTNADGLLIVSNRTSPISSRRSSQRGSLRSSRQGSRNGSNRTSRSQSPSIGVDITLEKGSDIILIQHQPDEDQDEDAVDPEDTSATPFMSSHKLTEQHSFRPLIHSDDDSDPEGAIVIYDASTVVKEDAHPSVRDEDELDAVSNPVEAVKEPRILETLQGERPTDNVGHESDRDSPFFAPERPITPIEHATGLVTPRQRVSSAKLPGMNASPGKTVTFSRIIVTSDVEEAVPFVMKGKVAEENVGISGNKQERAYVLGNDNHVHRGSGVSDADTQALKQASMPGSNVTSAATSGHVTPDSSKLNTSRTTYSETFDEAVVEEEYGELIDTDEEPMKRMVKSPVFKQKVSSPSSTFQNPKQLHSPKKRITPKPIQVVNRSSHMKSDMSRSVSLPNLHLLGSKKRRSGRLTAFDKPNEEGRPTHFEITNTNNTSRTFSHSQLKKPKHSQAMRQKRFMEVRDKKMKVIDDEREKLAAAAEVHSRFQKSKKEQFRLDIERHTSRETVYYLHSASQLKYRSPKKNVKKKKKFGIKTQKSAVVTSKHNTASKADRAHQFSYVAHTREAKVAKQRRYAEERALARRRDVELLPQQLDHISEEQDMLRTSSLLEGVNQPGQSEKKRPISPSKIHPDNADDARLLTKYPWLSFEHQLKDFQDPETVDQQWQYTKTQGI